jgi:hypothetical protein
MRQSNAEEFELTLGGARITEDTYRRLALSREDVQRLTT